MPVLVGALFVELLERADAAQMKHVGTAEESAGAGFAVQVQLAHADSALGLPTPKRLLYVTSCGHHGVVT